MFRRYVHLLVIGLVLVLPSVLGGDPPGSPNQTADSIAGEQAFNEIKQIREQLGGSVLRGSVLDAEGNDSFEAGVRKSLGLPEAPGRTRVSREMEPQAIVKRLRDHCSELDRIANEIERLREYRNADQLRATAKELRLIARHFDSPEQNKQRAAKRPY